MKSFAQVNDEKQVKAETSPQSSCQMWKSSCFPLWSGLAVKQGLAVKEFQAAMTYFSVLSFPSPTTAENTEPALLK